MASRCTYKDLFSCVNAPENYSSRIVVNDEPTNDIIGFAGMEESSNNKAKNDHVFETKIKTKRHSMQKMNSRLPKRKSTKLVID